jgi:hypothetical protein
MDGCLFLVLLAVVGYAVASPISKRSDSSTQPASVIYVVLAILIILALLAIAKHLYMKNRRATSIHLSSITSRNYYDPFSIDSYCRSSTSLPLGSEKECHSNKAGFFVGLLGSPAWETKVASEVDAAVRKQHQDCSFNYQLHAQSRQRSSQPYQQQRTSPSILPPRPPSSGNGDWHTAVRLSKSSSLNLPKRPPKSHDPLLRRFSLPSRVVKRSAPSIPEVSDKQSRSGSRSERKRSRGLKIAKNHISKGASLRMADATGDMDLPISRSPVYSPSSSPLFLSNPFPPKFKSRISSKPLCPLPSLPMSDPFSSAANASSTSIPLSTTVPISRPFPLLTKADYHSTSSVSHNTMKGRSRDSRLYQELLPVLKPLDVYAHVPETNQHFQSKQSDSLPATRQALVSVSYPTNCALPSLPASPPVSSVPILAQKAVLAKPRTKQKSKNDAQARARRSSSLGPSPLRAMILPDVSSGSDIGSPRSTRDDKENYPTQNQNRHSHSSRTSDLAGEFGELSGKLSDIYISDQGPTSDSEFIRASMNAEKASKILLNMAREREDAEGRSARSKGLSNSSTSRSRSWEPFNEVDLGLLGLDRFVGETQNCNDGMQGDSEIDFVSFWEEARLLEEEEQRRYVVIQFSIFAQKKPMLRCP